MREDDLREGTTRRCTDHASAWQYRYNHLDVMRAWGSIMFFASQPHHVVWSKLALKFGEEVFEVEQQRLALECACRRFNISTRGVLPDLPER